MKSYGLKRKIKMSKQIIQDIEKEKLIVIVRGVEKEKLLQLADAMYAGGVRFLEVTYDSKGEVTDEQTAENIHMLVTHFKGKICIGAGTVLTERQVELTANAGGEFIISPDTCPEVIAKTKELGMVSIPGVLTPTEIQIAHKAGADFIKLFPVTSLGTSYVKAVKAPLSHIKFLAVGGIDENNMQDYLKAGVSGFGVGSNIIDKKMLTDNDWSGITELAKKYVNALK